MPKPKVLDKSKALSPTRFAGAPSQMGPNNERVANTQIHHPLLG